MILNQGYLDSLCAKQALTLLFNLMLTYDIKYDTVKTRIEEKWARTL